MILSGGLSVFQGRQQSNNNQYYLGHESVMQQHLNFNDIYNTYGSTFPPDIQNQMVLLKYKGIKFLFKF